MGYVLENTKRLPPSFTREGLTHVHRTISGMTHRMACCALLA